MKNCISMPKLQYFLRTSPCFLQKDFLERYDKLQRNSLCKVTNVKMDDNQFLQAVLVTVACLLYQDRTALLSCFFTRNRNCDSVALILFLMFSVVARKLSMTGSIRIFEKLNFIPKLRNSYSSRSNFQI